MLVGFLQILKTTIAISLAAVVIMVPGTKSTAPFSNGIATVDTPIMQSELHGWVYGQATDGWVTDDYPRSMSVLTGRNDPIFDVSVAKGNASLNSLIEANAASDVVGFGYSQGAAVITQWLGDHANGKDPDAPPADKLSFVLIGSPNRPNGGLLARIPGLHVPLIGVTFSGATPESQYRVTDVVRQYDLFGDFPVDPLNVFALLNMFVGGDIHGDYTAVDINDPDNWVETDGNTTYIMARAKTLPLADALRSFAALFGRTNTPIIDSLEPALRYFVELGYDRTNQGVTKTLQPGSSIPRFFESLPQFADAVKQGVDSLKPVSRQPIVNPPANDTVVPNAANTTPRSVGQVKPRVLPPDTKRPMAVSGRGNPGIGNSGVTRSPAGHASAGSGSRGHSARSHR